MKSLPWFRMYTDFLNDPKMIALAFEDQRHFIGILALKSDGAIDDAADENLLNRIVAQRLWVDHGVIRDVKKRLNDAGLIDNEWQPVAWDKRQFVSDKDSTAAERKRRERSVKATANNVTDMSRVTGCDMSRVMACDIENIVTRLDTDTDTDTDIEDAGAKAPLSSSKMPSCPHELLIDLFIKHLPALPQPRKEMLSDAKAKVMKARWQWVLTAKKKNGERYAETNEQAIQWFTRFFAHVAKSDFLTGQSGKFSSCDLGWLMKEDNFAKVVCGNYDNRADHS